MNTRFLVTSGPPVFRRNFDNITKRLKALLPLCVEQGVLEFVEGYDPREFEVL
jgi:hypothetical protein